VVKDLSRFDSDLSEPRATSREKDWTIAELVTPTLTLQELMTWVDAQLSEEERTVPHRRTARPEWADLEEAA